MPESTAMNDLLIACVKACGGSKVMGPKLFPALGVEGAQRRLLDCLNADRDHHNLTPDQVLLVMLEARDRGFHTGMDMLCSALRYAPTTPIEPRDELSDLIRQNNEAMRDLARRQERIERLMLQQPGVQLRSAA